MVLFFFKFMILEFLMEKCVDRLQSNMTIGLDYFNQSLFGWEPLLEPFIIKRLAMQWRNKHFNFDLVAGFFNLLLIINIDF